MCLFRRRMQAQRYAFAVIWAIDPCSAGSQTRKKKNFDGLPTVLGRTGASVFCYFANDRFSKDTSTNTFSYVQYSNPTKYIPDSLTQKTTWSQHCEQLFFFVDRSSNVYLGKTTADYADRSVSSHSARSADKGKLAAALAAGGCPRSK